MIIAVDFDGTCVKHAYPYLGEDIGAQYWLKEFVDAGAKLILWTMRSGDELIDAEYWFYNNNIPLFGVNSNPEQHNWTDSPKAYPHLYIDDAAYGCPLYYEDGQRPYVDWNSVGPIVLDRISNK